MAEKTKEEGRQPSLSRPQEEKKAVKPEKRPSGREVLKTYVLVTDNVPTTVQITKDPKEFVPRYLLKMPVLESATKAVLEEIENKLIATIGVKFEETVDQKLLEQLKGKFREVANKLILKELPHTKPGEVDILAGLLIQDMLGLGTIEVLLRDDTLEEVVINRAQEPIWVYHKQFGWLKSNVALQTEEETENAASIIGRRVGRQITILSPLMDAYLISGDRVNATLFPISSKGNTITIRKFRRNPWTIADLIENGTVSPEVMSLVWLAIQYELSIIVSGGTGSGKTTFLNSLMSFIPPNHRIISIEDTRELNLPSFLHWVPMTTREANQEGKGEITMLDLLVNSLRMRPDRIIVGEIRRQREAEVLFEAMLTGHSVYSTLHANTADQTIRRMTTPPISIPPAMLEALDLVLVMFRDRRKSIRRAFELAEIIPAGEEERAGIVRSRTLFRWRPKTDTIEPYEQSVVLYDKLALHTGMGPHEIDADLAEKRTVLDWLVKNRINTVNTVGKTISTYYTNRQLVMDTITKGGNKEEILGNFAKELLSQGQ